MNKSHLIVVIVVTLLSGHRIDAGDSPSFDCLAAYSRAKGAVEPEFDVKYDSTREECTKAIRVFSDKIRNDIIEKMAEVSTEKKQMQCINGKFTNDDTFVNNIIKGEALASLDDKGNSEKLRGIEKFAEEFITSAITSCLSE